MSRSDRIVLAAGGGALILLVAAAFVMLAPADPAAAEPAPLFAAPSGSAGPAPTEASLAPAVIVVDVAGAVAMPGLVQLPTGSRIGDALAAAGGFATDADLDAAAAMLNLAQPLADGEQIRVPRVGEAVSASTGAVPDAGASAGPVPSDGLVDLNTATPEALEALPGIGPVTVQKIVAARQERPFASLEEAVERGVIHRGQLEDIRELATAG